jgi:2'-5' RNA ligase
MTKEKFSIWLIPSNIDGDCISKSIQSLSKKYLAPIFKPHCTIISPITNLNKAQIIIDQLDQKEFQVNVKKIDESDDIWKTVFLKLVNNSTLKKINGLFNQAFPQLYQFDPHISLIYKKLDAKKRKSILTKLDMKKAFIIDKISIVRTSGSVESWETVYNKTLQ